MTEESFVYGVELRSPPPTTVLQQLTHYERFLKSKVMSNQFPTARQHHQQQQHANVTPAFPSSLFLDYVASLNQSSSNLTSSIGEILQQNILTEWSLREAAASNNGTIMPGSVGVVVVVTTVGSATSTTTVSNRTGGDTTFQNNLIIPLYATIFLLSVVGNLLVILTLAQNKRMRTVTNVYLLNLAISDLLLGVFCMPFTLVGQVLRKFIFGAIMCKLIPYFQAVSVSVAVWTLVAISLERYFAICRPLSSRRWQTQFHAYRMIAMVWLLSFLVNSPLCYVQRLQPVQRNALNSGPTGSSISMKCREMWPDRTYERVYVLFLDAGLLVFPLLTMGFAYCMIVSKLWRGLRREISHTAHQNQKLPINSALKETPSGLIVDSTISTAIGKKSISSRAENACYLKTSAPNAPSVGSGSRAAGHAKRVNVSSGKFVTDGCSWAGNLYSSERSTTAAGISGKTSNNNNYCYANNVIQHSAPGGASSSSSLTAVKRASRFRLLRDFMKTHYRRQPNVVIVQKSNNLLMNKTTGMFTSPGRSQMLACASTSGKLYNNSNVYSVTTETTLTERMATATAGTPSTAVLRPAAAVSENGTMQTSTPETGFPNSDQDKYIATTSLARHAIRSTYMDKSIEAKKKVIRMLFVIIVEFFVCWAPLHILNTVYLYSPAFVYKYVSSNGIALVQLMAYISSCCNPITYCFMNRRFRQAFLNIFGFYQHRAIRCLFCGFRAEDETPNAEHNSAGSRAVQQGNSCGTAGANNSDISGNDSITYIGRSIVQRSEIMVLETEDRV
ncbi:dopamine D2-like receptor [Wyeomyia smithii]|uniref:dopamine D2-like receptor n=1 Tax=Wyeomyia smithii TaxID=174621 RepID=UPI002467CDD9|nr:dopamine D2-like receptor [Wyeomyia smithii]XP_055526245.1 dopamine D2-like receptor [Wyeomyia smithii]XP_055526246.1 dopamine D2-like receptor [Wyeomyia smithii]